MSIISKISAQISLPEDQIKGFTLTIISLLLSFFLPKIQIFQLQPKIRQTIFISIGLLYFYFMFGNSLFMYHLLPTILMYYLITKTKASPVLIFAIALSYSLVLNIERMINRYGVWDIQIDSSVMIWMQHVSSVGWDFREGKIKKNELTLLSFLEYIYLYINTCFGPFIQYQIVQDYIKNKGGKGNIKLMFRSMFFYVVLFLFYLQFLKLDIFTYLVSDSFEENIPYLFKLLLMMFACSYCQIIKYSGAWSAIDMDVYFSGIGYYTETKNGKTIEKWDKVQSVSIPNVFISYTMRDFVQAWNVSAQFWLKHYIFFKIVPEDQIKLPSSKNRIVYAEFITFVISAIWHGLYPGYFIFFTGLFLLNQIWKHFYKYSELYFKRIPVTVGKVCSHLLLVWSIAYFSSSFILLDASKVIRFYSIIGYWPFIFIFCVFVFTKQQERTFTKKIIKVE